MAQDFEFRSFLLQVSNDMTSNDFMQIKYLLKGYVPNAKCEQIETVCNYFEELERMCLLSPTNFGVLKMALNAIGRQDLVEMIEQKELYFADLFREKKGDSLGQKEYDAVCDGITKAAETLEVFSRSGHNTSELQKKLKLAILENEDDVQLEEISDVLTTSAMPTAVTELGKQKRIKKEEQPTYMEIRTGGDNGATVEPSLQIDNAECVKIPLEEAAEANDGGGAMAAKDHLLESKTTEHELTNVENSTPKTDQKEPSEDTVPDCNEQEETEKTQVKHNMAEATTGVTGVPSNTIPSYSSHQKLNDDVVTDGKDDDKGKGADSNDDAKTTSKEAEHLSPQHYHGPGARPKDPILKTAKTAGPSEDAEQKATAQAEQAEHLGPQHSHGQGARPKKPLLKTGKTASPSEAAEQKATEQADQVAETNPHGTLFVESSSEHFDTLHPETANSKEPTESEYSSPSSPTGDVISIDDGNESDELYSDENEGAELLKEKPKSTMYNSGQGAGTSASKGPLGCYHPPGVFSSKASYPKAFGYGGHAVPEDYSLPGGESTAHGPGHGASASASASASKGPLGCHHPPDVFSSTPSYQKASGYSAPAAPDGWSLPELMGLISAMDLPVESNLSQLPYQQQMAMLYQLLTLQQSVNEAQGLNPSTNPIPPHYSSTSTSHSDHAADSPLQANCYSKAGYSVVITNGVLCENTDEKGVVMMESGTQFCIAVANDNNYAAEVDITFGGMYLGVWVLEAKQSLSSPLIIQGSSWAAGRLRFFSASDVKKPKPSADIYGENPALNGRIELEFKPEVKTMKVYAKHVRKEELVEISIIDSKTATFGDLKQEISKKWKSDISYLMKGGEVLQEERTISSYALNENEVIEVLNAEEELMIESVGRDPVTMMVDPHNVSVESVKNFILKEIKIEVDEQLLRFKGQDIDVDFESLTQMLIRSKKVPVLKVDRDRNINVMVRLPDRGSEEKIAINWFATVDDLKEKLEERNICNTSATLKYNETGEEISRQGSKKLIDLGFKNKSEVTVLQTKTSTHRGFSSSAFDGGSGTRGFGGGLRGFGNYVSPAETYRGFSTGTRAFRTGPEKMEHDSSDKDGVAMLYGTEKNVAEDFQVDESEQQFSKEKAVTLVIQLKGKSMGATGGAGAAASPRPPAQSGAHYSGGPTGPMSTPTPPPVPE